MLTEWSSVNNFSGLNFQDAFFRIGRNEGITSLWSGLPPTLYVTLHFVS